MSADTAIKQIIIQVKINIILATLYACFPIDDFVPFKPSLHIKIQAPI